jgi:hypothetical protein
VDHIAVFLKRGGKNGFNDNIGKIHQKLLFPKIEEYVSMGVW